MKKPQKWDKLLGNGFALALDAKIARDVYDDIDCARSIADDLFGDVSPELVFRIAEIVTAERRRNR